MMISQKQLLAVIRARSEPAGSVDRIEETHRAATAPEAGAAAREGDGISLSERAKEVVSVTRALGELPDVREDLVRDIKERIEAGTYDISAEDVAEKILGRAALNNVLRDGG